MVETIDRITEAMPDMLTGDALVSALADLPSYDPRIVEKSKTERLLALTKLYSVYVPSFMSAEIYQKLYIALMRSLQKKGTKIATQQAHENHLAIKGFESRGIIGGSDSFTIIGGSGIGKSSAVERAISLITGNRIIEVEKPYCKIIPCLVVQCPFDASVKGMLLEILRKTDDILETKYYSGALRARATTDMLIGSVSQICLNHVGMLIIDEIQNIMNSTNGNSLIGSLTQLINNSGVSICMVGTPECTVFFESAMQLARRSLGLKYDALPYDDFFTETCKLLFGYSYTKNTVKLTQPLIDWLYEHSRGIMAVLITLLHDAQEIAILAGTETLDKKSLESAFETRLTMMRNYLSSAAPVKATKTAKKKNIWSGSKENVPENVYECRIAALVDRAKDNDLDIAELLSAENLIVEVAL